MRDEECQTCTSTIFISYSSASSVAEDDPRNFGDVIIRKSITGSIREIQVQRCHKKFQEGNFSDENEQRSDKTIHVDNEDLKALIESEPLEN
ncbi:hypothetical protein TNCV_327001 [Trichonephila clavipes]|nr:hypothetical protein TNCV_327001 [Trichonephila clavipes]